MTSKEYFDKVAERWDSMRAEFFSEKVREKIVELAGAKPGMLAADVGAGTGFMTEELVKRGLRVIAIDQSEMMLQQLRRKLGDTAAVDCRLGSQRVYRFRAMRLTTYSQTCIFTTLSLR
jgi:ubiquinone/menaquinone biosynthesis C-methylase UbiE